jgi:hypothetical protein
MVYRMPREPSTPRIAVWRKLRRLGAVQLGDGVVTLPETAETLEQFEWLAEEVTEAGGEALVWSGAPTSAAQERSVLARMAAARADEYLAVAAKAAEAPADPAARLRVVRQLRRELYRIDKRDHVHPPEREIARRAVDVLAQESVVPS